MCDRPLALAVNRDATSYTVGSHSTNRQPLRNRVRRTRPQAFQRPLDVESHLTSHPPLMYAVRAQNAVGLVQGALEAFENLTLT